MAFHHADNSLPTPDEIAPEWPFEGPESDFHFYLQELVPDSGVWKKPYVLGAAIVMDWHVHDSYPQTGRLGLKIE